LVSTEEVKERFEKKIQELKEELPKKYKGDSIHSRNCAAWTVASMLELLNIEDTNIINMASPLAGITRICGAVEGGLMMVGLIIGENGKKEVPQWTAAAEGMKYIKRFEKKFCSVKCPDLTGHDLLTMEGMKAYIKEDVWGKKCYMHVVTAIEILGKLYKRQIAKLLT